jgi:hypothetical protein
MKTARIKLALIVGTALLAGACAPKTKKNIHESHQGIGLVMAMGIKQSTYAELAPTEAASKDVSYVERFGFSFNVKPTSLLPEGGYKVHLIINRQDDSNVITCPSARLDIRHTMTSFDSGLGCTSIPQVPQGCNTYTAFLSLNQDIGNIPGVTYARSEDFDFQICNKVRSASLTLGAPPSVPSGAATFSVPFRIANTGEADLRSAGVAGDGCASKTLGDLPKGGSTSGSLTCSNPYAADPQPVVRQAAFSAAPTDSLGEIGAAQSGSARVQAGTANNPATRSPRGFLDSVDNQSHVASGWAVDEDVPFNPIQVHFYIDAPAGTGTFIGSVAADRPRADVNAAGIRGDHGYSYPIPTAFPDGTPIPRGYHRLYAYGIDSSSNPNTQLSNSGIFNALIEGSVAALPAPDSRSNTILSGQALGKDQRITSADGRYILTYQGDGNLVIYRPNGTPVWSSRTAGTSVGQAWFLADGDFVISDASGTQRFSAATFGNPGAFGRINNDGSFGIYSQNGRAAFMTPTDPTPPTTTTPTPTPSAPPPTGPGTLRGDNSLRPGQELKSGNGRYSLTYQGDGNLVLYDNGRPIWASNTAGTSAGAAYMQADGNLVVYDASGRPVFASNTSGNAGAYLVMQNDSNLVIYSSSGRVLWSIF